MVMIYKVEVPTFDINRSEVLGVVEANGFYNGNGYFCIGTKGRDLDEVMRLSMHELVHVMVREERLHFEVEE
jgi:hypothetical protein